MKLRELFNALMRTDTELEMRVGDVSEGDDLHCSVGKVVLRGSKIIIVPGDDDIWQEEQVASSIQAEQLWPKEL